MVKMMRVLKLLVIVLALMHMLMVRRRLTGRRKVYLGRHGGVGGAHLSRRVILVGRRVHGIGQNCSVEERMKE